MPALNPYALGKWRRIGQMATVRPLIAWCSSDVVRERLCLGLDSCLIPGKTEGRRGSVISPCSLLMGLLKPQVCDVEELYCEVGVSVDTLGW